MIVIYSLVRASASGLENLSLQTSKEFLFFHKFLVLNDSMQLHYEEGKLRKRVLQNEIVSNALMKRESCIVHVDRPPADISNK